MKEISHLNYFMILARRISFLKALFIVFFSFQISSLSCQNETSKWYFGVYAGLDFMTNPPTILVNSAMSTIEGCAVMSNASGNLLFYTDGLTVWNQFHQVMPNGTGLAGNSSSTQSGVIVKQPGNSNIYYVFTLDWLGGANGFRYSIVDMLLAGGNGSVTAKNVLLHTPSTEKLTAVKHCNGTDIWIISHDHQSNNFRTFLLTSVGLNLTPVLSPIGSVITNVLSTQGFMKSSPNGKKIGAMVYLYPNNGSVEIFDFNNVTGVVSNSLSLGNTFDGNYGCEFSPDNTKFYVSSLFSKQLVQWDLCAGSNTAIVASLYTVATSTAQLGGAQLAQNGKIYIARWQQQDLGVINNPNAAGAACNYVDIGQSVSPKSIVYGINNFMTSYLTPPPGAITYSPSLMNCQTLSFNSPATASAGCYAADTVSSRVWLFGDPASGQNNNSVLKNPAHIFTGAGVYTVSLILYYPCNSDTVKKVITVPGLPQLTISTTPSMICAGAKTKLTATGANSYTWNSGINGNTISVNPTVTTSYTLTGKGLNGCSNTISISLIVEKCTVLPEEANSELQFKLHPNPNKGEFEIEVDGPTHITISNPFGQIILTRRLKGGQNTVDLRMVENGVYFVRLNKNGTTRTITILKD